MPKKLRNNIVVDEEKFHLAAQQMEILKNRTNALKEKLSAMYDELSSAIDTSAGQEVHLKAKNVLLKPVENMSLVVGHISDTLNLIIGSGYYKDVFTGFEELSHLF